jgi:glycosyltransferase 2 family protein
MNKRLKNILQFLFFLGLGIFLVWWSIRDLDAEGKTQIRFALQNARYWLVIPVFVLLISAHYVRALRWRLLIEPLGYNPGQTNTFFAVMIGYLANQAIPRLGEVLKCTVLARYEHVPADKLIGTIILERLIDAITLLIIFGITLGIQPGLYSQLMDAFFNSSKNPEEKKLSGYIVLLIIGAVALAGIFIWMLVKKKKPADLFAIFKKIAGRIWEGVTAVRLMKKRFTFIGLTILLWTLYLAGGYIGFFALQQTEHYGIKEAFTVLSAGSVGMIITPGGIGAYAFLLQKIMPVYGLNSSIALAFGWLLWLAQTGVIVAGGLFSFIALPWYNKKKPVEKT